jgi:type IV secretion system protein VirB10
MTAGAPASGSGAERAPGVLPVVARPRGRIPAWVAAAALATIALFLFVALDGRRKSLTAPAVRARSADVAAGISAPPPDLYVPPEPPAMAWPTPAPPVAPSNAPAPTSSPSPTPTRRAPVAVQPEQPVQAQPQTPVRLQAEASARPQRIGSEPTLVVDTTTPAAAGTAGTDTAPRQEGGRGSARSLAGVRAGAGVLANRATTVPQGTIIPAVLETALDSTRPGLARAIVSRDVRGFDGTRILVPRGSRLIGEYDAEVRSGQNRMLVNWIRLIRPDGATIAIDSPAADTLGRSGIRGSVNTHFFERFAGAILQSSLDIGVNLASRSVRSPVVLAYPGSIASAPRVSSGTNVEPTLKVKPASSISIFVARDLDFTGVENR